VQIVGYINTNKNHLHGQNETKSKAQEIRQNGIRWASNKMLKLNNTLYQISLC